MKPLIFTLVTYESTDEGTFGRFVFPNGEVLHSLERPWKNNASNISCIPAGLYAAELRYSPSFGKSLYRLEDFQTHPRSAILIHAGNFGGSRKDGYFSDVEGCIMLGTGRGMLSANGKDQKALTKSATAMQKFHAAAGGEPILVHIVPNQNFRGGTGL